MKKKNFRKNNFLQSPWMVKSRITSLTISQLDLTSKVRRKNPFTHFSFFFFKKKTFSRRMIRLFNPKLSFRKAVKTKKKTNMQQHSNFLMTPVLKKQNLCACRYFVTFWLVLVDMSANISSWWPGCRQFRTINAVNVTVVSVRLGHRSVDRSIHPSINHTLLTLPMPRTFFLPLPGHLCSRYLLIGSCCSTYVN